MNIKFFSYTSSLPWLSTLIATVFVLVLESSPLGLLHAADVAAPPEIETLRHYPADEEFLNSSTVELGKKVLLWQIERGEMAEKVIRKRKRELEHRIEDLEQERAKMSSAGMGVYAFTSDTVRSGLIGRVLERLLEVRLEIAASEAVVKHLSSEIENESGDLEFDESAFDAQERALRKQVAMLEVERKRLNELVEQGAITTSELTRNQLLVQQTQAEIAKLGAEKKMAARASMAKLAGPLADARVQLIQQQAREQAAQLQLEQIMEAASFAPEVRKQQREIDLLKTRLATLDRKAQEQSMQIEEAQTLLRSVLRRMQESTPTK